jgi:hypothetical protein
MTYQETLEVVKQQNRDKSHRECQAIASDLHRKYKEGLAALKAQQAIIHPQGQPSVSGSGPAPATPRLAGALPVPELIAADKAIRNGPIDVAKIMSNGFQVIPDGKIINWGKAENVVNSLVTFEDTTGNRLPPDGYYEIFIAGR